MLVRIKVIHEPSHLLHRSIDCKLPEKRGDRVSTTILENALILRYPPPPENKPSNQNMCKVSVFSATCMTFSAYPLYKPSRQPMGVLRIFTAEHFRGVTSHAFINFRPDNNKPASL